MATVLLNGLPEKYNFWLVLTLFYLPKSVFMPFLYGRLRDTISVQFSPNYKVFFLKISIVRFKITRTITSNRNKKFFFFAKKHKYFKAMHRKALLEKLNNEHIEINILQI